MKISDHHLDAIKELINIGVGRAAGTLNDMLETRVRLETPKVKLIKVSEISEQLKETTDQPLSIMRLEFSGSFVGVASLIFPTESAANLVAALTGEAIDNPELDSLKVGTLSEVGNIVINSVMGSISNVLDQRLEYSIPIYSEETIEKVFKLSEIAKDAEVLVSIANFWMSEMQIQGNIVLFFEINSFEALLKVIDKIEKGENGER